MATLISRVAHFFLIIALVAGCGGSQENASQQKEVSEEDIAFQDLEPF